VRYSDSMGLPIITVTLEGGRIDCKVQGSPLSIAQYADAVALTIRSIAGLFASTGRVTEDAVVEEMIRLIDERGRVPTVTETNRIH
jgi:hypothetical protein